MIRRLLAVPALAAAMLAVGGPATASAGTMTLGAYSGLGAWIDIYDGNLMKTPDRTAAALKARGVNTIYLETGNSSAKDAFVRPGAAALSLLPPWPQQCWPSAARPRRPPGR